MRECETDAIVLDYALKFLVVLIILLFLAFVQALRSELRFSCEAVLISIVGEMRSLRIISLCVFFRRFYFVIEWLLAKPAISVQPLLGHLLNFLIILPTNINSWLLIISILWCLLGVDHVFSHWLFVKFYLI